MGVPVPSCLLTLQGLQRMLSISKTLSFTLHFLPSQCFIVLNSISMLQSITTLQNVLSQVPHLSSGKGDPLGLWLRDSPDPFLGLFFPLNFSDFLPFTLP